MNIFLGIVRLLFAYIFLVLTKAAYLVNKVDAMFIFGAFCIFMIVSAAICLHKDE